MFAARARIGGGGVRGRRWSRVCRESQKKKKNGCKNGKPDPTHFEKMTDAV